eukprot:GFUD01005317.1.p1 GENE.GFUD01005317.1~~GFUD01005317.1.p1  ORF type:complete len:728 (+),score=177.89 GFUD01005317.1:226-2409(+)
MSWLAGFAGKAEHLLNQLDQGAATVLKTETPTQSGSENSSVEVNGEKKLNTGHDTPSEQYLTEARMVVVDLVQEKENLSKGLKAEKSPTQTKNSKDKQQQEEQLIKFLNGSQDIVSLQLMEGGVNENEWKRGTTTESNRSFSPGSLTDRSGSLAMETDNSEPWGDSSCNSGRASSASVEVTMPDRQYDPGQEESSINYENTNGLRCDNVVSWKIDLATENQMLRQEISSLNQETTRVLARAKQAEKDVLALRSQLELENRTSRKQSETLRKMEAQIGDTERTRHQETEKLRKLIDEKNQENLLLQGQLSAVLAENQRHLSESEEVAGVQSQAILAMEERMRNSEEITREREATLEDERLSKRSLDISLTEKIKVLEGERQNNKVQCLTMQQIQEGLKLTVAELQGALNNSKIECGLAQKELIEYRTKAQRILQEKENFISQLKDGICNESEENVQDVELKQITKERNLFCEEATRFSSQLTAVRQELCLLEQEMQDEQETSREALNQLTRQLQSERERREELECDLSGLTEELRYIREDLTRAKTSHLTAIADKEVELKRLRNTISFREKTGDQSRDEDQRINQLTENLMKKQALLETISSQKNSMMYKIEHLERQLSEPSILRSRKYGLPFLEETAIYSDDRRPSFLQESPFDGVAARQVKRAYTEIDKLSIRVGIALRRYPIARIFVLFYMVVLHFWVFLVLFTYTPDTGMKMMTSSPESPYPHA